MADEPIIEPTEPIEPEDPTLLGEPTPPAEPPKPPEVLLTEPVSVVKADGTFIEGWKDKLPEELRSEPSLDLVTDFNSMVKQFVNQRKAIGKNKVAVPTDKSDESEWNAFYDAIGRPKSADNYTTPEIPEELSDIYNENAIKSAKDFAFKIGATQKQFNDYIAFDVASKQATIAEQDEYEAKQLEIARQDAEKALRTEFGMAYDERMHVAQRLITEAIAKETDRLDFIKKHGNDVSVIKLLSNIGARMSEDKAVIAELTQKTPTEVQTRINEIQNNKDYMNKYSDMSASERQQLTDELNQLYKQLHPPKTG